MERRHQVFISSTYADLKDERAEIIKALLELDCIPSGMELFPATNEDAWDLIKGIINDSDYYCLVVGGRYGSVAPDGIGYTEKEYDYALSQGKPLMAFFHREPGKIIHEKSEITAEGKDKLISFQKKVESAHHCKYWVTAEELGGQVSRSLINLRKNHPSDGWVPGRYAAEENLLIELANLRAKNAELHAEIASIGKDVEPKVADGIAHGADIFSPDISFKLGEKKPIESISVSVSWDTILKYVGPALIGECSDEEFLEKLKLCFYHAIQDIPSKVDVLHNSIIIPYMVFDQIKVQLRALGQMAPGIKRRAVADKKIYWKLTSLGESRLLSIQAITKEDINAAKPIVHANAIK